MFCSSNRKRDNENQIISLSNPSKFFFKNTHTHTHKQNVIGSFEEHELFNEVLFGIKNVIQAHLRDVQLRFEDQFKTLEFELGHRDSVIDQLRHRIHELEGGELSPVISPDGRLHATPKSGNGSTGSSGDIPFVVSVCKNFQPNFAYN